jgi:hypothetical protein
MTAGQSIQPFAVKQGLDGASEINAANPIPANLYVPTIALDVHGVVEQSAANAANYAPHEPDPNGVPPPRSQTRKRT